MPLIPDQGEKREGKAIEANIWHRKKKQGDRKGTERKGSKRERNEGEQESNRGRKREKQMKIERKTGPMNRGKKKEIVKGKKANET